MKNPIEKHLEPLGKGSGVYYDILERIETTESPFQKAEVIQTETFKKTLILDGYVQIGEEGECFYGESMAHLPLVSHPFPEKVLIIGGGDGGIAREVLKHNCITSTHLCEIDSLSIDMSKKYFPQIHKNCWDDPRFSLFLEDGRLFIQKQKNSYDVVISDMTDPFGPSAQLYTQEFFQTIKESFTNTNGVFCMHAESPVARSTLFASILKTLESQFKYVVPFYIYIQMYGTIFCIAISSDNPDILNLSSDHVDLILKNRNIGNLQVITGNTYISMRTEYPIFSKARKKGFLITQENCNNLLDMQ